ncbi:MAG: DUF1631 family protein, partial [Pseudomonadales bacterium]|nr:DUF1631 family protein [Pseudomonadales bacterium]
MSTAPDKTERRRWVRHKIKLDATLLLEPGVPVQCEILDFCRGGLFLGRIKSAANLSSFMLKNVTVEFSTAQDPSAGSSFSVDLKIMRVTHDGVGLAFENVSTAAYQALCNEAERQSEEFVIDHAPGGSTEINLSAIEKSFRPFLDKSLHFILEEFFQKADEGLKEIGDAAATDAVKSEYIDAKLKLRTNAKQLADHFYGSFYGETITGKGTTAEIDVESQDDENPLSLVEKNEFERWLNISTSIHNIEASCGKQLEQIGKKLGIIYSVTGERNANPLSPEKLCISFQTAIETNNESNKIEQFLYRAFVAVLTAELPDIYQELVSILANNGVTGEFYPGKETVDFDQSASLPNSTAGEQAVQSQMQTAPQHLQQNAVQGSPALIQPGSNSTSAPVSYDQPLGQTAGFYVNLLRENSVNLQPGVDASVGHIETNGNSTYANYPEYSQEELQAALAQLQKSGRQFSSSQLNDQLATLLVNFGSEQKKLSVLDSENLQVSGTFFETIFEDPTLPNDTKEQLESIQLAISSQALQAPGFLSDEAHPARNIVNRLEYLGSIVGGKGSDNPASERTRRSIEDLVNRITEESFSNPEVFAQVDKELADISEPAMTRSDLNIRRVIESYEGKQKMDDAKQLVQNQIDARIAGKTVPRIVPTLLDAGWRHLLILTALREGDNSPNGQIYLTVIDKILKWLSVSSPGLFPGDTSVQKLLDLVDRELSVVCIDTFVCMNVVDELTHLLRNTGIGQPETPVEMIDVAPANSTDKNSDAEMTDQEWDHLARLQVGEWFMFSSPETGLQFLKLVWISNGAKIFVFIDRKGQKKLELDNCELVDQLQNGVATKIDSLDIPLMDRATSQMLQNMHDQLMLNTCRDAVTGLSNQTVFEKQLNQEMSELGEEEHLLCFIEITGMQAISIGCGLSSGEQVLKDIATLIQENSRKSALFAKIGESTFSALLKDCSIKNGEEIVQRLQTLINNYRFIHKDQSYSIGANMALVPFTSDGDNVAELLKKAGALCLSAKNSGHNKIKIYSDEDEQQKTQSSINEWTGRIDQLLSGNGLFLRCQKIDPIDPEKSLHSHYEILLGIKNEQGDIISPEVFIPAVEQCHRMPEIDRWVVEKTFNWIENNADKFDKIGGFAINLSGQSLNSLDFLEFLKGQLIYRNIVHKKITFEITESVAADDLSFTEKFVRQVKRFGCKFSLDDFGTGYSSYAYLKRLNIDFLKIDGVFIKDLVGSESDEAMVKSMNEIGHSLGMETVAEYVENDEIKVILKKIGVDYAQGCLLYTSDAAD